MNTERRLFLYLTLLFLPLGPIYLFFNHGNEPVGAVALFLTALLCGLIAFYLTMTGRRFQDRPEDNPAALISEQEGDYGFFSPYSWWPLWLGLTGAICFLGLAVGWWLFMIGAFFGVVAVVGWTFEHYRGIHAN
jgi:uncharacterized membrane protein